MRTIKSFLSLKQIVELNELECGEIAILKNKLYMRDYSNKIINLYSYDEQNKDFIAKIYGIRSYYYNNAEVLQYVLINRHIQIDGSYYDEEKAGNESGLSFSAADNKFNNGLFDTLEPFKSMTKKTFNIREQTFENKDLWIWSTADFVKLPIFYKNKVKTKITEVVVGGYQAFNPDTNIFENVQLKENLQCDYYLISEYPFDDFYPVESHTQNNQTKSEIYIESDWRQQEQRKYINKFNSNSGIETNKYNCCLINDFIFYGYIYYIYMIKTKSFHPFQTINPQKKSVFIIGADGFYGHEGYDESMAPYLNTIQGGPVNTADKLSGETALQEQVTPEIYEQIKKYKYYVKLTTGTTSDQLFRNIFFEDCNYNINGCTQHIGGSTYRFNVSLMAQPKFNLTSEQGCVWFLISEIMKYQKLTTGTNNFLTNKIIYNNTAYPYIIKTIPHFYTKNGVHGAGDGFRKDLEIENNTYTDSGNFCIDNLRNILPVTYNAYIPFTYGIGADIVSNSIRISPKENYNTIINSGISNNILQKTTYEKSLCLSYYTEPTQFFLPTYDKNKVTYYDIAKNSQTTQFFDLHYNTYKQIPQPSVTPDNNGAETLTNNIIMRSRTEKTNQDNGLFITQIQSYQNNYDFSYIYKATKIVNDQITFNWLATSIVPLAQEYEDYNHTPADSETNDPGYGNNFFTSRLVCY